MNPINRYKRKYRWTLPAVAMLMFTTANSQWIQTNGPCGGTVKSLALRDGMLFAGTVTGAYRSTDNGAQWFAAGLTDMSVECLISDAGRVYAGTRNGVYISDDDGRDWAAAGLSGEAVWDFAASGLTLYAATRSGVFASSDKGMTWNSLGLDFAEAIAARGDTIYAGTLLDGVLLSTDRGKTWAATALSGQFVDALAMDGQRIYAGTVDNGVMVTTDRGATWMQTNDGLTAVNIISLAVQGPVVFAGTDNGVFVSTNSGRTWRAAGLPTVPIWSILFSSTDVFAGLDERGIYRTNDSGSTWSGSNAGLMSMDVTNLAVDGNHVYAGTRGGMFVSTDNGEHWSEASNGLTSDVILSLAAHAGNLYAGTAGGGVFFSSDQGVSWSSRGLPLSSVRALAGFDTLLAAGVDQYGVCLSTDRGASWGSPSLGASFVLAFAYANGKLLAATDGGVFLSSNAGRDWSRFDNGLIDKVAMSLAVGGGNSYAGTTGKSHPDSGGVFRWNGGDGTWQAIGLSGKRIGSLVTRGSHLFACASNSGVFHSTNAGSSWTDVSMRGAIKTVRCLGIGTEDLFAGTGRGVWRRPLKEMVAAANRLPGELPSSVRLEPNYPNPFVTTTDITFRLEASAHVTLSIHDVSGKIIATLADEQFPAGKHIVRWNAERLPAGMYICRLQSGRSGHAMRILRYE